jgi:hypothetical protein
MLLGRSLLVTILFPASGHLFMKYLLVTRIAFNTLFFEGIFWACTATIIINAPVNNSNNFDL